MTGWKIAAAATFFLLSSCTKSSPEIAEPSGDESLPSALAQAESPREEAPAVAPREPGESATPVAVAPQVVAEAVVTAKPEAEANPWTTKKLNVKREGGYPCVLEQVRVAKNQGFDRSVFQFRGTCVPGYQVEYVDTVYSCGPGEPVKVAGRGVLRVSLVPAQAHEESGKETTKTAELRPSLPVLEQLKQVCDFEAHVEYGFGVKAVKPYRVLELTNPSRIVVDIQH